MRWLCEVKAEGELVYRVGRTEREYVAEWPSVVTLRSDLHGRKTSVAFAKGISSAVKKKSEQGFLLAMVRHLRGRLTLHGGCVAVGGRAVVVCAPSRGGKSTLVHALSRVPGVEFLADDTSFLKFSRANALVETAEKYSWLRRREKAGERSVRVKPRRRATRPAKLVAILLCRFARGPVRLTELTGARAMEAVLQSVIRFAVDDPARALLEFEQIGRVLSTTRVYQLERPKDLRKLGLGCDRVLSLLRDGS